MRMKRIIVTNDDGIESIGLFSLARALATFAEVWVVAPERDQSGASHALTTGTPLRWRRADVVGVPHAYGVGGTPADCVYFGLSHLLAPGGADLVVSGINRGYNLADDITYSGTVAAALEGALLGVPGIAISLEAFSETDLSSAARFACALVESVLGKPELLPAGSFLNVNIPCDAKSDEYKVTVAGRRVYSLEVQLGTDPKGRPYFWIGGDPKQHEDIRGSDCSAVLDERMISVTPLHIDLTSISGVGLWRGGGTAISGFRRRD